MTQHMEPMEDVLELIAENKRLKEHLDACLESMDAKNKRIKELEAMVNGSS